MIGDIAMRFTRVIYIVSTLILVAACTTTKITANKAFEQNAQKSIEISQVTASALPASKATPAIVSALESAVQK